MPGDSNDRKNKVSKNVFYKYNPETDNFERYYPTLRARLSSFGKTCSVALLMATVVFFLMFYCFDSPTEKNLRNENTQLKARYGILSKRLDNSMRILAHIQDRDDNFYRVMMQMEPMTSDQRLSGLENDSRYKELRGLNDAGLVATLTRNIDLMERQIYAQVQSFDQLRDAMNAQDERLKHIPSVIPIADYKLAAGFGYRRDPVSGFSRLHEGMDLAAATGTPVATTGNGVVIHAERIPGYGNCIDIDHGYNYTSRYAHLRDMKVKVGDEVKRGDIIGTVGSTGKSTAPHLHYEVRFKDEPQNPVNYYFMDLSPEEYSEMLQTSENAGYVMD